MSYKHLTEVIKENSKLFSTKNAIFYKNIETKNWDGISWENFYSQIQNVSKALINFGTKEQQNVAIFAQNMTEWIIADIAIMNTRAVTVPIYATNSAKETEYIINDAEISVIFVGGQEEYDKAVQILETNIYLKLIVAFDKSIVLDRTENSIYLTDFIATKTNENITIELQKRHFECDLGDGWEDSEVHNDPKEVREKALKMGANILNYIFNN